MDANLQLYLFPYGGNTDSQVSASGSSSGGGGGDVSSHIVSYLPADIIPLSERDRENGNFPSLVK